MMGKAEERAKLAIPYHLFQIDRDLDDGEKQFNEIRDHFDKRMDEMEVKVRNLTRIASGVLVSLTITSITLLLNLAK